MVHVVKSVVHGGLLCGSWWFALWFRVFTPWFPANYSVICGGLLHGSFWFTPLFLVIYSMVWGDLGCGFPRCSFPVKSWTHTWWGLGAPSRHQRQFSRGFLCPCGQSMSLRERKKQRWTGALGCQILKTQDVDPEQGDILGFRVSL